MGRGRKMLSPYLLMSNANQLHFSNKGMMGCIENLGYRYMNDIKYTSLLPELINEKDDAYAIVEDLRNVLEVAFDGKEIKNIALTGPYGSGKSSILKTLKMVLPKERCVLELSLATLRVDDTSLVEYQTDNQFSHDKSAETITEEELNRKIEYSILQQLIYRESIYNRLLLNIL